MFIYMAKERTRRSSDQLTTGQLLCCSAVTATIHKNTDVSSEN